MIEINPIRSEADYEATLSEVEGLMDADPDTPESDRLDVLVTLVEAYEDQHHPMGDPGPIAAIQDRMESLGLDHQDLAPIIGSHDRVATVLARRAPLTLDMIRHLHQRLRIPADVLIQPYELERKAG